MTQVHTSNQSYATVTYTNPTGSDNCPGTTVVCSPASGSQFAKGTNTVSCTDRKSVVKAKTCSFKVIVEDHQNPTVTCPADKTQNTDANQCYATVTYTNQ